MKKILTLVLVFSLVLVGVASTTFAFGNGYRDNVDCVLEEDLDLSQEQEEKIETARDNFIEERNEIQEKIREYHRSAEDNQEEVDKLRSKLETLRDEFISEMENILTEEQLQKIDFEPKVNMYQGKNTSGQNEDRGNGYNNKQSGNGQGRKGNRGNGQRKNR